MLFSYFISPSKQFTYRWLFGAGLSIFVIGIGIVSTNFRQQESEYIFTSEVQNYRGIVTDIPQDKPRSTAYRVILPDYEKKIVCYFRLDSLQGKLKPGDEFIFRGIIQPFQNIHENESFDYITYMHNQGYSGSVYVPIWEETGYVENSLKIYAQRWRQQILHIYKSLGLSETEFAILSALTLGYQDTLSDDVKQAFRTTGTIHVLSVSGLHVGIIYLMITFLLRPISRKSKFYKIKPLLIILLLWTYAFITGLSPSVTRASIMLTMFCLAEFIDKKSNSIHAMYIAAFLILLYNPLSFFHIGFQLSFLSVIGILYLYPQVLILIKPKNKLKNYLWQGFILSFVAQLATFPLCLYYFGTFPTYFFITNLLVVPLITIIMYVFSSVIVAKVFSYMIPVWSDYILCIPIKAIRLLLCLLTEIIHFFERLPFSLIQNVNVSFIELCLLYSVIICTSLFLKKKKSIYIKISLISILGLFISNILYECINN